MNADSAAAVIANDLDSLVHRIEALPPNSHYTRALIAVAEAKGAIGAGRADIHTTDDAPARRAFVTLGSTAHGRPHLPQRLACPRP